MRAAKTIDELYDEVKDYDLVLCNDAPLALALGNRVRKPLVGMFSSTPRQLAGDVALRTLRTGTVSDIRLVKLLSKYTGYDIRFVHGEVDNILRMRRFTSDIRPHLGKRSRRIYDELQAMPTLDNVMAEFDAEEDGIFDGLKVAVIGGELYDDLDKHFNPKFGTYDEISPFKRGEYRIEEIRELGNDRQVAENAVSLVSAENAEDVAIVMDVNGPIADAVRSALYRRRIPFINSLSVKDLHSIRDFLEFLSLSLSFETIRVKHARELLSAYDGFISSKYDNYMMSQYPKVLEEGGRTSELIGIMRGIKDMTFLEVCEKVVRRGKDAAQVKILLGEMELSDEHVAPSGVDDMTYAVNNIGTLKHNEQIPEDEKKGVLLVDCQKSVYIDRPLVIYLGMGQEWEKDPYETDFLSAGEKEDERERNAEKFQILMQQGVARVYICNSSKRGVRPAPCIMFGQAEGDRTFVDFSEVCDRLTVNPWYIEEHDELPMLGEEDVGNGFVPKPFSKTTYNRFVECPRKYMFGTITRSPDKESTVKGTMIHGYAEFRVTYPEKAKELGIDFFVDEIASVCAGLSSPENYSIERSEIMSQVSNIDAAVDLIGIDSSNLLVRGEDEETKNYFMKKLGLGEKTDISEIKCVSRDSSIEGIFDLLWKGTVYDFKTGKPLDSRKIASKMVRKKGDYVDYQPLFYLALLDESFPENRGEFRLFFAKDGDMKVAKGEDYDVRSGFRTVKLVGKREDMIPDYLAYLIPKYDKYDAFRSRTDVIAEAMAGIGLDAPSEEHVAALSAFLPSGTKSERDSVKGLVEWVYKTLTGDIVAIDDGTILVTRKALDDFRAAAIDDLGRIGAMYNCVHPAEPLGDCGKCDFVELCTSEPVEGGESDLQS